MGIKDWVHSVLRESCVGVVINRLIDSVLYCAEWNVISMFIICYYVGYFANLFSPRSCFAESSVFILRRM
jgi:hypothetical protein